MTKRPLDISVILFVNTDYTCFAVQGVRTTTRVWHAMTTPRIPMAHVSILMERL